MAREKGKGKEKGKDQDLLFKIMHNLFKLWTNQEKLNKKE